MNPSQADYLPLGSDLEYGRCKLTNSFRIFSIAIFGHGSSRKYLKKFFIVVKHAIKLSNGEKLAIIAIFGTPGNLTSSMTSDTIAGHLHRFLLT